jgi:hypothetical protein
MKNASDEEARLLNAKLTSICRGNSDIDLKLARLARLHRVVDPRGRNFDDPPTGPRFETRIFISW